MVGTLKREKMQKAISDVEERIEANPEDLTAKTELEKLRSEERAFRLEQSEDWFSATQ